MPCVGGVYVLCVWGGCAHCVCVCGVYVCVCVCVCGVHAVFVGNQLNSLVR